MKLFVNEDGILRLKFCFSMSFLTMHGPILDRNMNDPSKEGGGSYSDSSPVVSLM